MSVTETSEQGYFSRIGSSIKGVFGGIIVIILAFILLFWNEGRSVDRYETIEFARNNYVDTAADKIESEKEGKLVYFKGATKTDDVLNDDIFGVQANNSLSLNRAVEMYQWIEVKSSKTEKKAGGKTVTTTTYSYKKDWSSKIEDSSSFKEAGHDNPNFMPYEKAQFIPTTVTLGAHKLPPEKTSHLGSAVATKIEQTTISALNTATVEGNVIRYNVRSEENYKKAIEAAKEAKRMVVKAATASEALALGKTQEEANATALEAAQNLVIDENAIMATINKAEFYSTAEPKIGDVKITFTNRPVCDATVIAKQQGDTVTGYKTKTGDFYEIRTGLMEAEDLFKKTEEENAFLTWLLRGIGLFMIYGGFCAIFKPISVLADVLPIFGDIAEAGISMISACLAAFFGLGVIAIAWLFCRPLLAIFLFILMGAAIFGVVTLIMKVRAAKKNAAPAPAAEPEVAPEA